MPNTHSTLTSLFTDIANAIRAKTGNSGTIVADNFPTAISGIPSVSGALVTVYEQDTPTVVTLEDSEYPLWTPSTTAGTILYSVPQESFVATDLDKNDYIVRMSTLIDIVYKSGTTIGTGMFIKVCHDWWTYITRKPTSVSNFVNETTSTNEFRSSVTATWADFYYSNSTLMCSVDSNAYGFHVSNSNPAISSYSSTSPTITIKNPEIQVKCSSSYFSTSMAANVDQEASTITYKAYAYKVVGGYDIKTARYKLIDMYNNGLT